MKLILLLILSFNSFALTAKKGPMLIGSNQKKPHESAVLEIFSDAKGLLPPRLTTLQRDGIAAPATGLEIYNVDSNSPQYFNGVTWVSSGGTGTSFQLTIVAHGRPLGCPLSPVYFDGTDWLDARADGQATLATHVITRVIDTNTLEISQSGRFSCNAHALTSGQHYFTGVTGGIANFPAPSFNNPILLAENTDIVHVMPYRATGPSFQTVGQVDTVYGRTGNVIATLGDYGANLITFSPTGTLISTDVQSALVELDNNIQAIDVSNFVVNTRQVIAGSGLSGGGDLTADRTFDLDINSLTSKVPASIDEIAVYDGVSNRKVSVSDILSSTTIPLASISDLNTTATSGQVLTFNGTDYDFSDKTINTDSQDATNVPFTSYSFYASLNVQDIIEEIEASLRTDINDKAENNLDLIAGFGLNGGGDLTASRTFVVDPSVIDITTLSGYNANSFIDMSTISIDVSDVNDGLQGFNTTLDSNVTLAVDIPSLSIESPAKPSTHIMGFSFLENKLVKVSVQDIVDTAAGAISAPVADVNGQIGIVVLDADDIAETASRLYLLPSERTLIVTNQSNITTNTSSIGTNTTNISGNGTSIGVNSGNIATNTTNITSAQTDLDAAELIIAGIGTTGFSNDYGDLDNLPTLGTASATAITDYATAAQGLLAATATQPLDNISTLTNDSGFITAAAIPVDSVNAQIGVVVLDADDISDASTTNKFSTAAQLTLIDTNESEIDLNDIDISTNATGISNNTGNIVSNDTDIGTNAANTANHISDTANPHAVTATQVGLGSVDNTSDADKPVSTAQGAALALKADISSLGATAFSNDYGDLDNLPTLGTAAATAITDYATAAQGLLAGSALQSGDNISELVNDSNYVTAATSPVQSVNGETGIVSLVAVEIPYTAAGGNFYIPVVTEVKGALDQLDVRANTNAGNITVNASAITVNATNIATNTGNLSTNVTNIASNDLDIAANLSSIGTNTGNIATNTGNVAANITNIATNTGNISTNTTGISTNVTNIAANATAIGLKYDASNPNGYETPVELDARDVLNRARASHTGTQLAATISDFDTAITTYNDRFFDQNFTQITTTIVDANKFDVTYNIAHAATYIVTVEYNWAHNSATNDFEAELYVNDVAVKFHVQEPKDPAGPDPGGTGAGTNQQYHTTLRYIYTAVAGNNDFRLTFRSSDGVTASTIRSHTLTVERY